MGCREPPFVDRLLKAQSLLVPNTKSKRWFENLLCIRTPRRNADLLQTMINPFETQDCCNYIAVSYPCQHTPKIECARRGRYRVLSPAGEYLRQSKVRDEVLSRVIQFAKYHNIPLFWIDKECIPQDNPNERRVATDSMDLVYRHSSHPVGLLAVTFQTQEEVNNLQALLSGKLLKSTSDGMYPRLVCNRGRARAIFKLLRYLYTDRWWTRAWIFQEEYLSSTKMCLMIRCKPSLLVRQEYGFLRGEMCFKASSFREQATRFLFALKRDPRFSLVKSCSRLLKRFGKYNFQYCFQNDALRRAMSPRIFADVLRRAVKDESDYLSIIANSCDYAIRFNSQKISGTKEDMKLYVIALYLLNGEVLRRNKLIIKPPKAMSMVNYLQYIAFNRFDPPSRKKHLSFLKNCRLHQVALCRQGISTRGHLWEICYILHTDTWHQAARWSSKRQTIGLNNFQRDYLYQLALKLQAYGSALTELSRHIENYLKRDFVCIGLSPAKRYMDMMVESIVKAIQTGQPLSIARASGSDSPSAIFVGLQHSDLSVFTSWFAGMDQDGRKRQKHVSLGVINRTPKSTPLLETVSWVNGLVFHRGYKQKQVIFNWPNAW